VVERSADFKLYLVTSLRAVDQIPEDLRARVTVIACLPNTSISSVLKDIFRRQFAPKISFTPTMIPRIEGRVKKLKFERELIDILAELGTEEAFGEDELTADLLQTKAEYIEVCKSGDDEQQFPKEYERFSGAVSFAVLFWEVLTRYLPRVGCNVHWSTQEFVKTIEDRLPIEGDSQAVDRAIQSALIDFAVPSLTVKEVYFVLFIGSLFKKRSDLKDLEEIVAHCAAELRGVASLTVKQSTAGDFIDQLKFANITNLFFFMHRQITDCFGADFGRHITLCPTEKFIPESARPVVIRAAPGNYPLPMLLTHVAGCEALDRLQFFSVLDTDRVLPVVKKLRNAWIVLHYSSASRTAARCLHAVCNFVQKSDSECGLIVFAETTDMFPENLLDAICLSVTEFPSLRLQTEQLFAQFQGLVRSQTNPVTMKKMAMTTAHLVTTMNWRRFIPVVGLADTPRIPDVVFRDLLPLFRKMLDFPHKDLPVRNYTEILKDFLTSGIIFDTFDRKIFLNHIDLVLKADVLMAESKFEGTALIPTSEPLLMDDTVCVPFANLSLSKWFIEILARLRPTISFRLETALKNIETALDSIPSQIPAVENRHFDSPLKVFLFSEIVLFNRGLALIRKQLLDKDPSVLDAVFQGNAAQGWLAALNISSPINLTKFLSYLADRTFFLKVWLKSGDLPMPVDVRLISNVKGLFSSYLSEAAVRGGRHLGELDFEFGIVGEKEMRKDCLVLTNCWLLSAGYHEEAKVIVEPTAPFKKIPQLTCQVAEILRESTGFQCPMFKSLPSREYALEADFERIDGEVENFVRYIELEAAVADAALVANGVAIVCHFPEQFE
jgi:hypothetical protein